MAHEAADTEAADAAGRPTVGTGAGSGDPRPAEAEEAPPAAEPAEILPAEAVDEEVAPTLPDLGVAPEAAPAETAPPVAEDTSAEASTESGTFPAPNAGPVPDVAPALEAAPPTALGAGLPTPPPCPFCNAPRVLGLTYCDNCGLVFPAEGPAAEASAKSPSGVRLMDRYELGELISQRGEVCRYRGLDHGADTPEPLPVILVRGPAATSAVPVGVPEKGAPAEEEEILPSFDFRTMPELPQLDRLTGGMVRRPPWPTLEWERDLLTRAQHPVLPRVVGSFTADGFEYLVEQVPTGRPLWDAWDDRNTTAAQRFGWLKQIAEGLSRLHQSGALLEGLRPDIIVITDAGQAMLTDLSDLLPLPVPPDAPIRGTLYTAPELFGSPERADARADLYSFGAMLYALHVGHELTENAFERQGVPKLFIPYFPDVHPLFGRLISKTFTTDPAARFPTDEAAREDPTGFAELCRTLEVCGRTFDNARLDIAAWTTTGIVRTGNEDAFGVLHAIESRQDDLSEYALVLLADGMGGYEAGEIAASIAIQSIRQFLLQHPLFSSLAGKPPPDGEFDLAACKQALADALREANKQVHQAAKSGQGRRGMGCTAEAVYIDGQHVIVGHVGDSRTYHLREGRLVQMTRDQTLIARLLELGQLTPEEAESHPRRSELQQAIGGRSDVDPELFEARLRPGDWVLVCSDGLSNHVKPDELQEMMQSEATSAEMAARRLVNFANLRGATDNATVVVVRAT
jgi:serine/threonine protein phosphatase PrpC